MKTNTDVKTKGIIKQKTKDTWQREHVRKRKKKKKRSEEKRLTLDSGSSSKIGQVTDESSLCLD